MWGSQEREKLQNLQIHPSQLEKSVSHLQPLMELPELRFKPRWFRNAKCDARAHVNVDNVDHILHRMIDQWSKSRTENNISLYIYSISIIYITQNWDHPRNKYQDLIKQWSTIEQVVHMDHMCTSMRRPFWYNCFCLLKIQQAFHQNRRKKVFLVSRAFPREISPPMMNKLTPSKG